MLDVIASKLAVGLRRLPVIASGCSVTPITHMTENTIAERNHVASAKPDSRSAPKCPMAYTTAKANKSQFFLIQFAKQVSSTTNHFLEIERLLQAYPLPMKWDTPTDDILAQLSEPITQQRSKCWSPAFRRPSTESPVQRKEVIPTWHLSATWR